MSHLFSAEQKSCNIILLLENYDMQNLPLHYVWYSTGLWLHYILLYWANFLTCKDQCVSIIACFTEAPLPHYNDSPEVSVLIDILIL